MLAVPAISSAVTITRTGVSVGSTRVPVAELITGQNGWGTERMCQDPHMSECVHIVCGAGCQCLAVTFGIMVGDEGVGGTTVTGRIAIGLWTTKGSDPVGLEGGLEVESVLKGLDLTEPCIFGRSNAGSSTIVNLHRGWVSQWNVTPRGTHTS